MKITRKIRNQAILIASVSACGETRDVDEFTAAENLPREAHDLWFAAWEYVLDNMDHVEASNDPVLDGEAECLLREGWSPQ